MVVQQRYAICGCPVSFRDCHIDSDLEKPLRFKHRPHPFFPADVVEYRCPKHHIDDQPRGYRADERIETLGLGNYDT